MANFVQIVEAPVQHAVQASTTTANMASELAGQYAGMEEDLLRTFNVTSQFLVTALIVSQNTTPIVTSLIVCSCLT
jgi:hypothetical protein